MQNDSTGPSGPRISFDLRSRPREVHSLPFRVLVLGNFGGSARAQDRRPIRVNKDNLKEVLTYLDVALHDQVANRLSERPTAMRVDLPITGLNDFSPGKIIEGIPELTALQRLVDGIGRLARGETDVAELESSVSVYGELQAFSVPLRLCRKAVAESASKQREKAKPSSDSSDTEESVADRIFRMVSPPPARGWEADTSGPDVPDIPWDAAGTDEHSPSQGLDAAAKRATRALSRQLDAVLHGRAFQGLEATWRGLKLLVDRTDFRHNILLEIMDVERDELAEVFHQNVVVPECEKSTTSPLSLVVAGFEMDKTAADVAMLRSLAEDAQTLQVPILFSVGAGFFGLRAPCEAASLPYVGAVLERPEFASWNALRAKEPARWLAAAYNPFLLRDPYASGRGAVAFQESVAEDDDYLWGNPAWVIASVATASFARHGWPTEISGPEAGGLSALPVRPEPTDPREAPQIPLAALLPVQLARDLNDAGLIPLSCTPNRDTAYVRFAPLLHKFPQYADDQNSRAARRTASLPYQLLVTRLVGMLNAQRDQWAGEGSDPELSRALEAFLRGVIEGTGDGADVQVEIERGPDEPTEGSISVYVRMGKEILNGAEVRLQIPRSDSNR